MCLRFMLERLVGWSLAMTGLATFAPAIEPARLVVPAGLRVERAAPETALRFPMFATLDDRGRLYVAESSGLDLYAEITAGTRKCRVSLLEDCDGDGLYETHRVFADRLVFPMGISWRDGRLYVADPPDLITLEDADGDGRAERRRVILSGFGHKDNGSLHGLEFGPDGMLSMTMGMPDGYRLPRGNGTWLEGTSGAWIRCRPDGTRPEVVSRGFTNLVELAFLPDGEAIGTDNWYQEPAGGFRDALVHLVEGGLYPYVPDSGTPQPVTGITLPPLSRFPAAALSGLARLDGPTVPAAYRGNLVSAQHNTRSVGRHVLVPAGATFRSEDSALVTTEDPDFHPSDVLVEGDGSVLIVDTGAWYVQHCPTGRIRPSSSQGGLFRIVWPGASRPDDPYGRRLDVASLGPDRLAALLGDPRPAVRALARRELAGRGELALPALADLVARDRPDGVAVEAVWTLSAIDAPAASALLRRALRGRDPEAASAAARALALRGDRDSAAELLGCVSTGPPRLRRAAVDALARCGDRTSLPILWSTLAGETDEFLRHALIHALHRLATAEDLRVALDRSEPAVQAVALTLLDQPPRPKGSLKAQQVIGRAGAADARLRSAALAALERHPEWAGEAARLIASTLDAAGSTTADLDRLAPLILRGEKGPEIQALLGRAADTGGPASRRAWALGLMGRTRLEVIPESWVRAVRGSLRDPEPSIRRRAVAAARSLRITSLDEDLDRLARDPSEDRASRLEAWQAVLPRRRSLPEEGFGFLIGMLSAADPSVRLSAAGVLGSARLDDAQRSRLLEAVGQDPLIMPETLAGAFGPPLGRDAAGRWLAFLEGSLRRGWRPAEERLGALLDAVPGLPADRRDALTALLRASLREREARLAGLARLLDGGDAARGREVFRGPKAACATCHRVGESGGLVGPDLTRIGAVRSGPDLLESLAFPSASFAQGYEPYTVALDDGRVLQGVVASQDADSVVLREPSGTETRLRRSEIEEMGRSQVSIMPEGLIRTLDEHELRDVLAFLRSLR